MQLKRICQDAEATLAYNLVPNTTFELGISRRSVQISSICRYSMILTKGMFIHRLYFGIYACLVPRDMLRFVDAHNSGEDIAMNFIVSAITGPSLHQK